jgi:nucleoside-diphosphate-sugar epimerase
MMETVIITGATGLIGTALTKALLNKGYTGMPLLEVRIINRLVIIRGDRDARH